MLRRIVVKRRPKIFCDHCGCVLRGKNEPTKRPQLQFYLLDENNEPHAFSYKDLCLTCRKWFGKLAKKIAKREGYREHKAKTARQKRRTSRVPSINAVAKAHTKARKLRKTKASKK